MKKGFTIVELISVIVILSLVAIIITPTYSNISNNIRKKNYESRKSEIKSQVISYIENYAKDKVYNGNSTNYLCFTPEFLIKNGIISSDDKKEEYIKNDYTGELYKGNENIYIKVYYNIDKRKLFAITSDETLETIEDKYSNDSDVENNSFNKNDCSKKDNEVFN